MKNCASTGQANQLLLERLAAALVVLNLLKQRPQARCYLYWPTSGATLMQQDFHHLHWNPFSGASLDRAMFLSSAQMALTAAVWLLCHHGQVAVFDLEQGHPNQYANGCQIYSYEMNDSPVVTLAFHCEMHQSASAE
jgi:hypothetical protein